MAQRSARRSRAFSRETAQTVPQYYPILDADDWDSTAKLYGTAKGLCSPMFSHQELKLDLQEYFSDRDNSMDRRERFDDILCEQNILVSSAVIYNANSRTASGS